MLSQWRWCKKCGVRKWRLPPKLNVWYLIWVGHTFNNHNHSIMIMQFKPLRIQLLLWYYISVSGFWKKVPNGSRYEVFLIIIWPHFVLLHKDCLRNPPCVCSMLGWLSSGLPCAQRKWSKRQELGCVLGGQLTILEHLANRKSKWVFTVSVKTMTIFFMLCIGVDD